MDAALRELGQPSPPGEVGVPTGCVGGQVQTQTDTGGWHSPALLHSIAWAGHPWGLRNKEAHGCVSVDSALLLGMPAGAPHLPSAGARGITCPKSARWAWPS